MTPLAQMIVNDSLLPRRKREFIGEGRGDALDMSDVHCFDVSEVSSLAYEISMNISKIADGPLTTFLPAPRTWIEYFHVDDRTGFLLEQGNGSDVAITTVVRSVSQGPSFLGTISRDVFDIKTGKSDDLGCSGWSSVGGEWHQHYLIPAYLLLINSPKIIGRKQHMPHRGLERKLTAAHGVGKYPLHAWSEIKLKVFKPIEIDDGEPHEAHLTGMRALHFCRAHIRIRLGRLEYVTSHWRGDPALGIKQARYSVVQ